MTRIKLKNIKGQGKYDPNTNIITLNKRLHKRVWQSKKFVFWHEKFHEYIEKKNLKMTEDQEELRCDIFSLMKCKGLELTYLERYLKKEIIKRHRRLSKKRILEIKEFL